MEEETAVTAGTAEATAGPAVAIAGGAAFVADGVSGLSVVSFLPIDNQKLSPTITLDTNGLDADPVTPGIPRTGARRWFKGPTTTF